MARGSKAIRTLFCEGAWPVWLLAAVMSYLTVGHGLPVWLARAQDSWVHALLIRSGVHQAMSWWLLLVGLLGAGVAVASDHQRRQRLAIRLHLEDRQRRDRPVLECWVRQAYQARGYEIQTAGSAPELVLRRADGLRILLQYQHWQREEVGELAVRELEGLMRHLGCDAARIVTLGGPTEEAARFVRGKPIGFVSAGELLQMIRQVRRADPATVQPRKQEELDSVSA
jgi:hypothetical protein